MTLTVAQICPKYLENIFKETIEVKKEGKQDSSFFLLAIIIPRRSFLSH